jgi:hypothetical protein
MIYSNKTISLIVQSDGPHLECMERRFGDYIKFDQIQNLRLEIQMYGFSMYHLYARTRTDSPFTLANMPLLRKVQVVVTTPLTDPRTFNEVLKIERAEKHLAVRRGSGFTGPLEELVLAVSELQPEVDVVWGLSDEEEAEWDNGGHTLMPRKALTGFRDAVLTFHLAFPEERAKAMAKGPPASELTEH